MRESTSISQKKRLVLLLVDISILCVVSWFVFGRIFPPDGKKGFWFYTALLGLLLGSRLDTPFYVKPADVVLYAAPAAIALALINSWSTWGDGIHVAYVVSISFCVVVGLLGMFAILTMNSESTGWQKASNTARVLSEPLGSPRILYSVVIVFALYAFHTGSIKELGLIGAAWVLTVLLSPLEGAFKIWPRLKKIFKPNAIFQADGEVGAHQTPNILLIRQFKSGKIKIGDVITVHDGLEDNKLALILDRVGRDEGILLRAIELKNSTISSELSDQLKSLPPNSVVRISDADKKNIENDFIKTNDEIVGLVAPDTSVERLFFEVVKNDDLEEGRLVEVKIGNQLVTYQIVNGLTKEEIVQQKSTHGYARAQAQKIGCWDKDNKKFKLVKWLPTSNSPVFLKAATDYQQTIDAVGHFPGTDYAVSIKNINDLVTHNTAILGILGVGKSMLAIELVERMIASKIKVICLDLTNQYAQELASYYPEHLEENFLKEIKDAGEKDKENYRDNPEDGGSLPNLRRAIENDIKNFLQEDNSRFLKIYNPSQLFGTKQISEPKSYNDGGWKRAAALWQVTPVEITRIITETTLLLLQDKMTPEARVCLVFEEAHSLVPEFNSVASPNDKEACNGTARAILQGRKYGLGCLLITQRTANVTKTILNQCNTVFAMRTFDDTGKDFLSNYIGKDYAGSLSSLAERQAVLFGKASSCENPVLIRLNDRDKFRETFRDKNPPPDLSQLNRMEPVSVTESDEEDDIPF